MTNYEEMSQKQLFGRFLDAPLRRMTNSTLVSRQKKLGEREENTPRNELVSCAIGEFFQERLQALAEDILFDLEKSETPRYDLDNARQEIHALFKGLSKLSFDFLDLEFETAELISLEPSEVPRYHLPVTPGLSEAA